MLVSHNIPFTTTYLLKAISMGKLQYYLSLNFVSIFLNIIVNNKKNKSIIYKSNGPFMKLL